MFGMKRDTQNMVTYISLTFHKDVQTQHDSTITTAQSTELVSYICVAGLDSG